MKIKWYDKIIIALAGMLFLIAMPIMMADGGNITMQSALIDYAPMDIYLLSNLVTYGLLAVYVYAVWLQRPKEFAFLNPTWWLPTCFGLGYIPRFFKKWWNYGILILAILALAGFVAGIIPIQTAIAVIIVGLMLKGAGTLGTLFACYLLVIMALLPRIYEFTENAHYMIYALIVLTILITALGTWTSQIYVKRTGRKDPSEVIIDEVAGMFLAVLLAIGGFFILYHTNVFVFNEIVTFAPQSLIVMFVLFRIFDIFKPWPIKIFEKFKPEGWGIMVDDLMAGMYAAVSYGMIVAIVHYSGGFKYMLGTVAWGQ